MEKMTKYIKAKYSNGRTITEEDFKLLDEMIAKASLISEKENYVKAQGTINKYLTMDIEEFQLIADEHSAMLSLCIDLEDCFDAVLNGSNEVFSNVAEAKKCLLKTLRKLSELKKEYNEYFSEEL